VSNLSVILEPTSPKAGISQNSLAPASPADAPSPGPSLLMSFAPLLILIPFLWLSSRRTKKEAEERGKLAKGDRVLIQGGLLGELVEKNDKTARVKIAQGVIVEVVVGTLSPVGATPDAAK
jgi:preprotein translocase subunit YajC